MPFVAGEAPHFRVAFKVVPVDCYRHVDHLAGCLLFLLVIEREVRTHMAELTVLIERPGDIPHLIDKLRLRKRLEPGFYVLEMLFGRFFRLAQQLARGVGLLR